MHAARRPAMLRLLTVAAFGALALTGCGGTTGGSAAAPSSVGAPATATTSASEKPFAGTKQFVTADKAWTEGGLTKLSVRSAEKKENTQFDTWEIVPGTGKYVTVTLTKDARVLLTVPIRDDAPGTSGGEPVPASQAEFVTLLAQLDPRTREGAGFDLSFDGEGQVTKVQSLYTP
ncbi:hypothetical protein [Streptomyces sp. TRM75563]|uniref:hypothetical protein n=1 Tax=Streptomyces sp. TRM75563 TaxID=2817418 RepID=UPI001F6115C5|nr:hypothetical protein [Streptomyces sp. TRM75563]MCI4041897.1 hypothetical protein [Streptomyces sp. TRM75563]